MNIDSTTIVFSILSIVAIFSAIMVISRANPVASVLWLVLNFFALAGLYVLLGAHFLAAVQIIVYAGAIMVLFLFVVMMLNLNTIGSFERSGLALRVVGALIAGLMLVMIAFMVRQDVNFTTPVSHTQFAMGSAKAIGLVLFDQWTLPFQIVGVMMLAAIIGVVALVKREHVSKPLSDPSGGSEQ